MLLTVITHFNRTFGIQILLYYYSDPPNVLSTIINLNPHIYCCELGKGVLYTLMTQYLIYQSSKEPSHGIR